MESEVLGGVFLDNAEHRCGSEEFGWWRTKSEFSFRKVIQTYNKNLEELIETPITNTDHSQDNIFSEKQIKNHYWIFSKSMKPLLLWGQCFGLIPITGVLDGRVGFKKCSLILWYCIFILVILAFGGILCLYNLLIQMFDIRGVAMLIIIFTSCSNVVILIRAASKWPALAKSIRSSQLAVNFSIIRKCSIAFWVLTGLGIFEYLLSVLANISRYLDCFRDQGFRGYMEISYPFLIVTGLTNNVIVCLFTKVIMFMLGMHWIYGHSFMVCIGIYLASVLDELNEKVKQAVQQDIPPYHWRSIREAYTRATQLVKMFEDITSPITLTTFGANLFLICYRLYFILGTGLNLKLTSGCPYFPSGPLYGYEQFAYYLTSLSMEVVRSLSFILFAASVHHASRSTARILYEVSPSNFCDEVNRFIEQIHNNTVALSGSDFFYITRELILSVANAIVTYELVLMQFEEGKDLFQRIIPSVHSIGHSPTFMVANHSISIF